MNFVQGCTQKSFNRHLTNDANVQYSTINFDVNNQSSDFSHFLKNSNDIVQNIKINHPKSEITLSKIDLEKIDLENIDLENIDFSKIDLHENINEEIKNLFSELSLPKADIKAISMDLNQLKANLTDLISLLNQFTNLKSNGDQLKHTNNINEDLITETQLLADVTKNQASKTNDKEIELSDINNIISQLESLIHSSKKLKDDNFNSKIQNITEFQNNLKINNDIVNPDSKLAVNAEILKKIVSGLEAINTEINQKDINIISNSNSNNIDKQLNESINNNINNIFELDKIKEKIDKILPEIKNLSKNGYILLESQNTINEKSPKLFLDENSIKSLDKINDINKNITDISNIISSKIDNIIERFTSDKQIESSKNQLFSIDEFKKSSLANEKIDFNIITSDKNNNFDFAPSKFNHVSSESLNSISVESLRPQSQVQKDITSKIDIVNNNLQNSIENTALENFNVNNIDSTLNNDSNGNVEINNSIPQEILATQNSKIFSDNNIIIDQKNSVFNTKSEQTDESLSQIIEPINNNSTNSADVKDNSDFESRNKQKSHTTAIDINSNTFINRETSTISNDNSNNLVKPYSIRINDIPRYVSRIVTNQMTNNQTQITTLNLEPITLGKMSIEISLNGAVADIKFKVENKDSIKSIESQIVNLKENLSKNGIKIESINISQSNIQQDADKNFGTNQFHGEQSKFKDQKTKKEYLRMMNPSVNFANSSNDYENIVNQKEQMNSIKNKSIEKYI